MSVGSARVWRTMTAFSPTCRARAMRQVLAFALLFAGSSCSEPTGVQSFAGDYVLERVDGNPLPVTSGSATHRVIADSIAFGADGRGTWIHVWEPIPPPLTTPTLLRSELRVAVVPQGAQFVLARECPVPGHCAFGPAERVTLVGGRLYIGFPGQGLLEYARAPAP